jgi:hypothetical protein
MKINRCGLCINNSWDEKIIFYFRGYPVSLYPYENGIGGMAYKSINLIVLSNKLWEKYSNGHLMKTLFHEYAHLKFFHWTMFFKSNKWYMIEELLCECYYYIFCKHKLREKPSGITLTVHLKNPDVHVLQVIPRLLYDWTHGVFTKVKFTLKPFDYSSTSHNY